MNTYVAALDQGTTSTRCMVFDEHGQVVAAAQQEHTQYTPQPGWVEHDAVEIWQRSRQVMDEALGSAGLSPRQIAALGITNQRETTVVWDGETGQPLHPAIVWQDTRTGALIESLARDGGQDRFRAQTGLPLATYFSGPKLAWLLREAPVVRRAAERGRALFGTIDTWLAWNLTGGARGGRHMTDVTNASRTQLMDLRTLDWDPAILETLAIPRALLPHILPSSGPLGECAAVWPGVPIAGILGDQQAALFGQACYSPGEAKNTYGTGCFLLLNTGGEPVRSRSGLLTTLAYQIAGQPPVYALEGSVAMAGALVQWLRDNLGLIEKSSAVEDLACQVEDNGGMYIVPAFSGLFAPYWRSDARGVMAGLTRYVTKAHIARAALEATAYQTREVLEAMTQDTGAALQILKVDGGMVANRLLMQFQADILGLPVVRSAVAETTALGAAYAAGLAVGYWPSLDALRANWREAQRFQPEMEEAERARLYAGWKKAVTRTFDWVEYADA